MGPVQPTLKKEEEWRVCWAISRANPTESSWTNFGATQFIFNNIIQLKKQKKIPKNSKGYFKIFVIFSHIFPNFFA
jgi:hypothetical protein